MSALTYNSYFQTFTQIQSKHLNGTLFLTSEDDQVLCPSLDPIFSQIQEDFFLSRSLTCLEKGNTQKSYNVTSFCVFFFFFIYYLNFPENMTNEYNKEY